MNRLAAMAVAALILCLASLPAVGQEPLKLWDEDYIRVRTGVTIRVVVHASIETGYYIVAAGGTNAKLTPLTLKMAPAEGITLGTPEYPTAKPVRLQQDAPEHPAFEGLLEIHPSGQPLGLVARQARLAETIFQRVYRDLNEIPGLDVDLAAIVLKFF